MELYKISINQSVACRAMPKWRARGGGTLAAKLHGGHSEQLRDTDGLAIGYRHTTVHHNDASLSRLTLRPPVSPHCSSCSHA
eukprot:2920047-Pleurochrysis_carterae.AAC.3